MITTNRIQREDKIFYQVFSHENQKKELLAVVRDCVSKDIIISIIKRLTNKDIMSDYDLATFKNTMDLYSFLMLLSEFDSYSIELTDNNNYDPKYHVSIIRKGESVSYVDTVYYLTLRITNWLKNEL